MVKKLVKTGNSLALIITKDMIENLGLDGTEVEVIVTPHQLILQKPRRRLTYEEARDLAFSKYGEALKELAK